MPAIVANSMRLHVRVIAPRAAPAALPALLIQGLGMQVTDWPRAMLTALARDRRVILFDNRDYGRSQPCGPAIDPALREADYPFAPVAAGRAPYSLFDMADDALGVLDVLGVRRAHVVGFSLGGMVAQILAARHPARVASLVSLMSSGGQAAIPAEVPAAQPLARMIVHQPDRGALIAQAIAAQRIWSGPGAPFDARRAARHAMLSYRRCYRPAAIHRQALAYAAAGERFDLLRRIRVPTLIAHGALDPVIPPAFARVAQRLIAGSRLIELPDAAHDLGGAVAAAIAPEILALWAAAER